jgi:pimeloyl-ACP methyl ester carboxylesterase
MTDTQTSPQGTPTLHHIACPHVGGTHRMAYWSWGDEANPHVVMCVHGLSRQGRDFDEIARALSTTARVICPDVVGRGQSAWLQDPMGYQLPTYVADMLSLMALLQAKSAKALTFDWVGTSMGGLIGIGVAAQATLRNAPPLRRLVINDVGPTIDAAGLARIGSYVGKPAVFASLQEAATYVQSISETFGPHSPAQWLALTRWQMHEVRQGDGSNAWVPRGDPAIAVPFKSVTPEMAKAGEAMLWMAYDSIQAKTLVVRGAESDLLSRATAQAMTQRGPKATLVEIPGVGHAPMFQHDDQAQVVTRFLLG